MAVDYGTPTDIVVRALTGEGQQFDFSLHDRTLVRTTVSPGGEGQVSFTMYGVVPYNNLLPIGTHITLEDRIGAFSSSFVVSPSLAGPHRAGDVRVQARGYGAACGLRRYDHQVSYLNPTVGGLVIGFLRDLCCPPLTYTTDFLNLAAMSARVEEVPDNFVNTDALTAWTTYLALGTPSPDTVPLLWHVIADPGGSGAPVLKVDTVPLVPKYYVRIAAGAVDNPSWSLDDIDNQAIAAYLDVDGHPHTVVVNVLDNPLKFGISGTPIVKSKAINVSGEFAESDATQYAHNIVNRFGHLRMSGSNIHVPWGVLVTDENGDEVPLWRVDAGNMIRVFIIDEHTDPTGYLSVEDRFISATSWDGTDFGLDITCGEFKTETRSIHRRTAERSSAVLGQIPGLSKREGPPLFPRDVVPQPVTRGAVGTPGESRYPSSEGHIHQGPDPTDMIWEQLPITQVVGKKGTEWRLQSCAVPVPYACRVLGWAAVSDAPLTALVQIQFGTLGEFPSHSTSMPVVFDGMTHGQFTLDGVITLDPISVVNFAAQSILPGTAATYLTVCVIVARTG